MFQESFYPVKEKHHLQCNRIVLEYHDVRESIINIVRRDTVIQGASSQKSALHMHASQAQLKILPWRVAKDRHRRHILCEMTESHLNSKAKRKRVARGA